MVNLLNQYARSDLELMVGNDEEILWKGRPDKKCYILEGIFNPLLPVALLWFLFDSTALSAIFIGGGMDLISLFFFLFHLMPVWFYLIGILLVFRRYEHTEYIVTDKGVYISGGVFTYNSQMKPYTEISRINIHRGIFDQYLKVGDIIFMSASDQSYGAPNTHILIGGFAVSTNRHEVEHLTIADIPEYQKVFKLVKKLQTDIFADTMYPNDLRPEENHGYKTKYKNF